MNRITNPQSGQGGGRGIDTDASWLNQGGEGGTGFRDKPAAVDDKSSQSQVTDRCKLSMMETELTALCIMNSLISCDPISCRKICKWS